MSACGLTSRFGDCQCSVDYAYCATCKTVGPSELVLACSAHAGAGRQPSGPQAAAGSG